MPFAATGLPPRLETKLREFARNHDFAQLYAGYKWKDDTWRHGFPKILAVEGRITAAANRGSLCQDDLRCVARWGRLRNLARVKCHPPLALPLYEAGRPNRDLAKDPLAPLRTLLEAKRQGRIEGLGPTYLSKVLRFGLPSEYGAIDTRVVRVVGLGDEGSTRHDWLSLRVRNYGYGWFIAEQQSAWPREYSTWINILRFLARLLSSTGRPCPHPDGFVAAGLRTTGDWACADVEMALFSYASQCLKGAESRQLPAARFCPTLGLALPRSQLKEEENV